MSYIGNTPGVSSQRVVTEEVLVATKSDFYPVGGYSLGYVDVLINGHEVDSNDFTATDGVKVSLLVAAVAGDTVKIKAWLPRGLSDGYLKSEADALLANKLATSAGAVGTSNLAANAVTYAKMQSVTAGKVLGRDTSGTGVVQELPIAVDSSGNMGVGATPSGNYKLETAGRISISGSSYITNPTTLVIGQYSPTVGYAQVPNSGAFEIWSNGTGTIAGFDNGGNFRMNSGYGSSAVAYGCRAWANFDGGAASLRGSGNVSSIGHPGGGIFTVNFSTALPDTNYALTGTATERSAYSGGSSALVLCEYKSAGTTYYNKSTGSITVCTADNGGDSLYDSWSCNVAIFR